MVPSLCQCFEGSVVGGGGGVPVSDHKPATVLSIWPFSMGWLLFLCLVKDVTYASDQAPLEAPNKHLLTLAAGKYYYSC